MVSTSETAIYLLVQANNVFHLVTIEAYYHEKIEKTDKSGIIIPQHNVACVKAGAAVIEGVSRTRDTLITGQLGAVHHA